MPGALFGKLEIASARGYSRRLKNLGYKTKIERMKSGRIYVDVYQSPQKYKKGRKRK